MSIELEPTDPARSDAARASPYAVLAGEAALWKRWHEQRDHAAREAIALHYMSYARALAAQAYGRRTHDEFEFDEYLQFATVGMMESLDRFDPAYGVLFKTFATRRITGAIFTGVTSLSEGQQQLGLRRRVADERLETLDDEAAAGDPESVLRRLAGIGVGLALGFILEGTGMMSGSEGVLPDNTYSQLELKQFQQRIVHLLNGLTGREQDVVRLHYFQGKSFDDIAQQLALTKGRISQLHKQALGRLRTLIADNESCDITL